MKCLEEADGGEGEDAAGRHFSPLVFFAATSAVQLSGAAVQSPKQLWGGELLATGAFPPACLPAQLPGWF